ncbi:PREDICTED: putative receptor-like protein kinase At4g00960 [Camelina sativa]|uniref:Receptor-like protein kinase At4g00960 n=1 Tax=Camelina sativa TaxID=90675 RepID=A0ABM0VHF3_CAMSA|nr:PREDICTED: putative receptor-like protein kinase At4g00960 [Camelina sativa]
MATISDKLSLILIIIVIEGSTFRRVSSSEICNGNCGRLTLPYPFGFSPGCPIRFHCSEVDQETKIGGYSVQNVTDNSIFVGLPHNCSRKIEDMTTLFAAQFAPTSENSFLMDECMYKTNGCSINQGFLENTLKLQSCGSTGNISCFSLDTNSKFFSMKDLRNSSCSLLFSSIAFGSVGANTGIALEFERVQLGWWLKEGCENKPCAENANCTQVDIPDGNAGHRCSCLEDYQGDGYINPCLRVRVKGNVGVKFIIGMGVSFIALVVISLYFFTRNRRKQKQRHKGKYVQDHRLKDAQLLQLDFDTVRLATNDFSPNNHLGEGGFGAVYKGVLDSGEEIAVKRLSVRSGQGDNEFVNEVSLVAKLQHRNLVRLLGFCLEGEERLLIYEFFKNTSLEKFIFDSNRRTTLDWETRHRIITGVARGLLYLHEGSRFKIIHRDMKASNVLLDDAMNPKIADFGMAKLFNTDQTSQTMFTSRVAGTYGYMAPEYAMSGQFSVKTDVYSFGVLVLEIIKGKKNNWSPVEQSSLFLLSYVWKCWREGKVLNIVDPSLINDTIGLSDEIMKCIHIGLLCVQENPESRPTMPSVVAMLNANSFTLPRPLQPAFYSGVVEPSSRDNNHTSSTASLNNVTITELDPR